MKNLNYYFLLLLTLSVFILPVCPANGQSWFENDHEWQFYEIGWSGAGPLTIRVTGDTVIQNKACKILTSYHPSGNSSSRIVYREGDAVYLQHIIADTFYAIYDFSLGSGDIVTMPFNSYQVSSTGQIDIDGSDRRYQIITFLPGSSGHMIIEGIGLVGKPQLSNPNSCSYLYPDDDYCSLPFDGQNYYFRCFAGSIYYSPFNDCTLANSLENRKSENIRFYPNPVFDWLTLEMGTVKVESVEIFDLTGRLIWQGGPDEGKVDFRPYPSGVYLVQLSGKEGDRISRLITVMR